MRFGSAKSRLTIMLMMTIFFFMVEIIVGYITNSMALIADSFHMLSDAVALIIAYLSVHMSPKQWSKNTFGWARAEILGALINAVFLSALCFSILLESIKRFIKPDNIHDPHLILIVGGIGLLVNLIGLVLFRDHHHHHGHTCSSKSTDSNDKKKKHHHHHLHSHHHHHHAGHGHDGDHDDTHRQESLELSHEQSRTNLGTPHNSDQRLSDKDEYLVDNDNAHLSSTQQMNMRGVFLHVMADALGSVIVMISALTVIYTDWSIKVYIDPTLSVIMVCLVLRSTWPLLTESAMILLQTVPTTIEVDSLKRRITEEIPEVLGVHELHIWRLAGERIIASAHIRCHNLHDYMRIAQRVKEFFHNEGIHSTTIQPEFIDIDENDLLNEEDENNCALDCPQTQRTQCLPQTCCGTKNKQSESASSNLQANLRATQQANRLSNLDLTSVTIGIDGSDIKEPMNPIS